MRISDWSSDVCSSDLSVPPLRGLNRPTTARFRRSDQTPKAWIRRVVTTWVQASGVADVGSTAARLEPTYNSAISKVGRGLESLASRLGRSEEHTSELQSLMRISYAVFCLKKKKTHHSQIRGKE